MEKVSSPWDKPFETLSRRWKIVPAGGPRRISTQELLALNDQELLHFWEQAHRSNSVGEGYSHRGWYYDLYRDQLKDKRVLDVGAGMGLDGLTFARHGARVTLLDIAPSNVELTARLSRLMGLQTTTSFLMNSLKDLDQLDQFDYIWCQGSMLHAPMTVIREEAQILLKHLPGGGRWVELAYPKVRWEREGKRSFETWGHITDGPDTPWAEWKDLDKVMSVLAPVEFAVVLNMEIRKGEFIWFDLKRMS